MRKLIISGHILFALLVASPNFISPGVGSWIYIIFLFLYEGFYFQAQNSHRRMLVRTAKNKDWDYSPEESRLMKEYPTFFLFPQTSRGLSSKMATIQLLTYIIVPWLLVNGIWLQAAIVGLNYFIATHLAVAFNPQFYIKDFIDSADAKIKKGTSLPSQRKSSLYHKHLDELKIINSILIKKYSSI